MSIEAKKSYKDGHVAITADLRCNGFPGDTARISARTDLTTGDARVLAASIIELADKEDAKIAKRVAGDVRRKVYRDREIAAGRMQVMSLSEIFGQRPTQKDSTR